MGDCLIWRIKEIYNAEKDQDAEEQREEEQEEQVDENNVGTEEAASGEDDVIKKKVHNHIPMPPSASFTLTSTSTSTSASASSSIFPLSLASMEEITKLCKEKLEQILHASQSQLIHIISTMHNKENEVRNHMR